METEQTPYEFNPDKKHSFYFIRKGLYEAMKENAHFLSGVMMDFGCGSKPYRDLFQVEKYIGVDYAGEGHTHENEEVDVYYDGSNIPFPDNYFDSILSSEVFEHLFEAERILDELRRVLKPKGIMLITCPFVWNEHEVPIDYARYTKFALEHLFTKHGFKILKYEKKGSFVETIFQLLNIYNEELIAHGGVFSKIPVLRGIAWKLLQFMPVVNNSLGSFLNSSLPKSDSLYLSNVLVVEKCG